LVSSATLASLVPLGFAGFTGLSYVYMTSWAKAGWMEPEEPPDSVAVIVPAYNEEFWLADTLNSIESQNVIQKYPEKFTLIIVDNGSTDGTVQVAQKFQNWNLWSVAQRGKLNARDYAIRNADSNIIIGADADTFYPPNTFNLLLQHFTNPKVVAVTGVHIYAGMLNQLGSLLWAYGYRGKLFKGCIGALRRDAYVKIGGFDLSINQMDGQAVWKEEEWNFYTKLAQIGKVETDFRASCYTSERRFWCPAISKYTRECKGESCIILKTPDAIGRYCQEQMAKHRF